MRVVAIKCDDEGNIDGAVFGPDGGTLDDAFGSGDDLQLSFTAVVGILLLAPALEEGLFVGMSSGAAAYAAVQVAAELSPADTVVVLLPDRGDRYLSTNLFRSICAECPP